MLQSVRKLIDVKHIRRKSLGAHTSRVRSAPLLFLAQPAFGFVHGEIYQCTSR
jgi:hypothetical protein